MADTVFSNGTVVEVDWAQDVNDHVYDKGATPHHAASLISITAVSSLSATNVQAALAEIIAERVASTNGTANNLNLTGTTTAIGPIVVPSGASGTQVRQAAEVVTANSQTGAGNLPTGTTAQRPTPAAGMIRNNTDSTSIEVYTDGAWRGLTLKSGTRVATTSGTAFDFTGIPDTAVEIFVDFRNVSLSGTDSIIVQLGESTGFITTGYTSISGRMSTTATATATSTAGFIWGIVDVASTCTGQMRIKKWPGSPLTYTQDHSGRISGTVTCSGGGDVALTTALTQVRITRTGTNTFDNGEVVVSWR
jgi:hypothetical protein